MKYILLLIHLLLLSLIGSSQPADSADYFIRSEQLVSSNGITLSQPWKYHLGDSIAWARPGYDDSHWSRIATVFSDESKEKLSKEGFSGRMWFRTTLFFDTAAIERPLALKISNGGAMSLFLDGKLLTTYGSFSHKGKWHYEDQDQPYLLNLKHPGRYELAIRYEDTTLFSDNTTLFAMEGFRAGIISGETAVWGVKQKSLFSAVLLLPVGSVFLALFFVHLLLFVYYRQDRSNLYFALFNMGASIMMLLLFPILNTSDLAYQAKLGVVWIFGILLAVTALSTFINHLFGRFGWRHRLVILLSILSLAAFLFFRDNDLFSYIPLLLFLLVALEAIILISRAIFLKKPGAKILGVGILFFFGSLVTLVLVILITGGFQVNSDNQVALAFMVLFLILLVFSLPLSISGYQAWKFASTNKNLYQQIEAVERLSMEKQTMLENRKEELEREVAARTQEVLQQKEEIESEKQKTDELLLNILPAEVAEELKREGKSKAQHFNEVTVLFTDFVNFTHIAEQLEPDALVAELNVCFTAFDNIMERYGLEKIKTIGDAYLAVSGLPVPHPLHAQHAVKAALEIVAFINDRRKTGDFRFEIRVGINSGPLVAGIVGVKKFAYDIWGDTVNVASRMETNSDAGKVNISEDTFRLVQHDFICTHRGKVQAKNKGAVDMYFVEAAKEKDL